MDIISQNRQIVRFLGWEEQKNPQERFFGKFKKPNYGWIKENELGFDCCWNSLMEVVEKIENINPNLSSFNINSNRVEIKDFSVNQTLFSGYFEEETSIKAVYKAVVEFIKWYNEQNK